MNDFLTMRNEEKINISFIAYKPNMHSTYNSEEDLLLYSRIFKNIKSINPEDIIVYYGKEDDKIMTELSLRFLNTNKIYLYNSNTESDNDKSPFQEISKSSVNNVLFKRYNMIEKAKESEVFGILVGTLSIDGLNNIIEDIKNTLKANNKKFYTFLLGKITLEKLSNFVDYIDCFVLIACPFNNFYDFKTLYKPLVSTLDVKIAFDPNYEWDMKYSFDVKYILDKNLTCKSSHVKIEEDNNINHSLSSKFTGLKLLEYLLYKIIIGLRRIKLLLMFLVLKH